MKFQYVVCIKDEEYVFNSVKGLSTLSVRIAQCILKSIIILL